MFSDLVIDNANFDESKFGPTLQLLQDRYDCLGIYCALVGTSTSADASWPACVDTTDANYIPNIAGYEPLSKSAVGLSKIDLDVSTILTFILMEVRKTKEVSRRILHLYICTHTTLPRPMMQHMMFIKTGGT